MKKYLQEMVKAIIGDDAEEAKKQFSKYAPLKSRRILGEQDDDEEKEEKEEGEDDDEEKEEGENDDEEKEDEDEMKESIFDNLDKLDEGLLDEVYAIVMEKKPSAGLSKKKKSEIVKKAKRGEDMGEKGKNFEKVARKAAKRYGSKERGEKAAGAAMWKNIARESVEATLAMGKGTSQEGDYLGYRHNHDGESYNKKGTKTDNSRGYGYDNVKKNARRLSADGSSGASDGGKAKNAYKTTVHKDDSRKAKSEDKGSKGLKSIKDEARSPYSDGKKENRRTDKAKAYHGTDRGGKELPSS
jgi:hypothetical protein